MAKRKMKPATPESTRVVEPGREMAGVSDSKYRGALGKPILWQAVLIVAAGLWVFWPALHGDWLWDDDQLISNNFQLHTPGDLWNIWFAPGSQRDYYPLEQSALWIEWRLWHNDTLGYHIVTLVLHLLNALLVWRLLGKLGLRLAWLGGLLFAIHPVQVESAAWAAELKNTLSLPPLLLAMGFYLDYEESKKPKDYFLAIVLFLAALLCKLTVVMFPVVILLYAWWKRGRIGWNDLKTSAPFFVLSLAAGLIIILSGVWDVQFNHLDPGDIPAGGFLARLALVGQEIAFYLSKSFLPVGLLPIYPKWAVDAWSPVDYLPWPILGGAAWWFWTKRESWGRHALLGLGFFVINLAPCPGFIPAPNMGYAWVMDHFLYLPIIGLIGLAVAILGQAQERLTPAYRPIGAGAVAAVMILLAWESRWYAGKFINQETLWTYTLQLNPQAYIGHNNLGNALLRSGRMAQAIDQYQQALQVYPDYLEAHNNLGFALFKTGRMDEAIIEYQKALAINPIFADARNNLGNALLQKGRIDEAMIEYRYALARDPTILEAHYSLGNALFQKGRFDEAAVQFEQAIEINPNFAEIHNNLGNCLLESGRIEDAISQYQEALRLKPDYADPHANIGVALQQSGRVAEAIDQYQEALRLNPDNAAAKSNLARAQASQKTAPAKK